MATYMHSQQQRDPLSTPPSPQYGYGSSPMKQSSAQSSPQSVMSINAATHSHTSFGMPTMPSHPTPAVYGNHSVRLSRTTGINMHDDAFDSNSVRTSRSINVQENAPGNHSFGSTSPVSNHENPYGNNSFRSTRTTPVSMQDNSHSNHSQRSSRTTPVSMQDNTYGSQSLRASRTTPTNLHNNSSLRSSRTITATTPKEGWGKQFMKKLTLRKDDPPPQFVMAMRTTKSPQSLNPAVPSQNTRDKTYGNRSLRSSRTITASSPKEGWGKQVMKKLTRRKDDPPPKFVTAMRVTSKPTSEPTQSPPAVSSPRKANTAPTPQMAPEMPSPSKVKSTPPRLIPASPDSHASSPTQSRTSPTLPNTIVGPPPRLSERNAPQSIRMSTDRVPEGVYPYKQRMKSDRKVKVAGAATTGAIVGAVLTGPAWPVGAVAGAAIGGYATKVTARTLERRQQCKYEQDKFNDYLSKGQAGVQQDGVAFA